MRFFLRACLACLCTLLYVLRLRKVLLTERLVLGSDLFSPTKNKLTAEPWREKIEYEAMKEETPRCMVNSMVNSLCYCLCSGWWPVPPIPLLGGPGVKHFLPSFLPSFHGKQHTQEERIVEFWPQDNFGQVPPRAVIDTVPKSQ